ncbi:hypothetical protein [Bradyrhizobium manausense]|uniref:Uncharacterized protein n=1 Tax=Bradyrhizobium manausense TaxID=989370 RepID=A0A0R3E0U4_9BRAD|nr:hypothetical protein [Bradyrhizobium manausense]KRQ15825.1 hypothetical protein AOQ71_08060 [Bradyrhizobium manausense]
MAARTYDHQRWSEDDDQLLRNMCETGKSLTLMIVKLKRPVASIRSPRRRTRDLPSRHSHRIAPQAQSVRVIGKPAAPTNSRIRSISSAFILRRSRAGAA